MKVLLTDTTMAHRMDYFKSVVSDQVEWTVSSPGSDMLLGLLTDADIFVGSPFTAAMVDAAPSLKLIQLAGAGTGGVDFEALPPDVLVANTFNHERSIAEHIVMAMLALSRRLLLADKHLRAGKWYTSRSNPDIPIYQTLQDRTVGFIGFGHIGIQTAQLARCLGMKVVAIKRQAEADMAKQYGLDFLGGPEDLPVLLGQSDFVIIASPLTEQTRGLISREQLTLMKPTAYLINVARGPIVDEAALYTALAENQIAGAALDVWYNYPTDDTMMPASLPFHQLDNVIMTPHNSGETEDTQSNRAKDIADNIKCLLDGRPLRNVVYPNK